MVKGSKLRRCAYVTALLLTFGLSAAPVPAVAWGFRHHNERVEPLPPRVQKPVPPVRQRILPPHPTAPREPPSRLGKLPPEPKSRSAPSPEIPTKEARTTPPTGSIPPQPPAPAAPIAPPPPQAAPSSAPATETGLTDTGIATTVGNLSEADKKALMDRCVPVLKDPDAFDAETRAVCDYMGGR